MPAAPRNCACSEAKSSTRRKPNSQTALPRTSSARQPDGPASGPRAQTTRGTLRWKLVAGLEFAALADQSSDDGSPTLTVKMSSSWVEPFNGNGLTLRVSDQIGCASFCLLM